MKDDNKEKSDLKYSDFENAVKGNTEKKVDHDIKDKFIPESVAEAECLILMVEIVSKLSILISHKRLVQLLKYLYEVAVRVEAELNKKEKKDE